jgi:protein-S-isoprenylcysteine O-methyltransferase Ste14
MRAQESSDNYDKSSLKILWTTIILSVIIGIFIRRTGIGYIAPYSETLYYTGISLVSLGLIIRWIAIATLKKSFTVNVSVSEDQKLVQSGIYKHIRHPSYLGSLLSFLGLGLVFHNWLTLIIIFIPILSSFLYRIYVEEKVLRDVLGIEYINYIKRSKKLIPKVY